VLVSLGRFPRFPRVCTHVSYRSDEHHVEPGRDSTGGHPRVCRWIRIGPGHFLRLDNRSRSSSQVPGNDLGDSNDNAGREDLRECTVAIPANGGLEHGGGGKSMTQIHATSEAANSTLLTPLRALIPQNSLRSHLAGHADTPTLRVGDTSGRSLMPAWAPA